VVLHAETAILRHAALGDIEFAHDLYTRDDGGVVLLGHGLHGRLQHTVNAIFDDDRIALGFDVDVAGPLLKRGEDRGVVQADDRADVGGFRRDPVDVDVLIGRALFVANYVEHETFAGFIQNALRLLGLFQNVVDLVQRGDARFDAPLQQHSDLVDHHQLAGIGDRDPQRPVAFFQWNKAVAEHQVDRNRLK